MTTINELFTSVLGRTPSAGEAAYWTTQLGGPNFDEEATNAFASIQQTPYLADRANAQIQANYTYHEPPPVPVSVGNLQQFLSSNPAATPQQIADTVKSLGGLTPEMTNVIAQQYGSTPTSIQTAYNELITPGSLKRNENFLIHPNPRGYVIGDAASFDVAPIIGSVLNVVAPGAGVFVGESLGVTGALSGIVGNAVINAGLTAAQGGSPLDSLTSSGIGALIGAATSQVPGFDSLSSAQKAFVNNAVRTAVQNGDVTQSLVNTAVSQAMGEITKDIRGSGALPSGTQVASNDGSLPTVEVSGSPIYADSSSANSVKAPFGFDLMPSSLSDNRPSGAFYDQFQNAWFMPNEDIKNLSTAIQGGTSTGSGGASTSGNGSLTLDNTSKNNTSTTGSNTSTAPLSSNLGNITITDKRPVTDTTNMGTINVTDTRIPTNVVTPTTTVTAPTTTVTPPTTTVTPPTTTVTPPTTTVTPPLTSVLTPSPTTKTPVKTPTTASNISQITSDAASIGALPTSPSATMLSTGQLEKQANMLKELTHLYPQLSNVDPRLLSILSGKARSGSHNLGQTSEGGATPLMSTSAGNAPSAGMPFRASSGNAAGLTSSSGSGALARAGLNLLSNSSNISGYAKGGLAEHNPEFITGATGHHVKGEGDGQSDSIPAMLADGEYVFDADTVAALGNGSNDAGARILDKMRENLRKHKRSAPAGKIPPKAKSPLEYMKG